jgi:hypothetical protein
MGTRPRRFASVFVWSNLFPILSLLLAPAALAETPLPEDLSAFCADPFAAVCGGSDSAKDFITYRKAESKSGGNLETLEREVAKPTFDETKQRFISFLESESDLPAPAKKKFLDRIKLAVFMPRSEIQGLRSKFLELDRLLPKESTVRQSSLHEFEAYYAKNSDRLTSLEKQWLVARSLPGMMKSLVAAKCLEMGLNDAHSVVDGPIPIIGLCTHSELGLAELETERRYPILIETFAHELGHQIGTFQNPELYTDYAQCMVHSGAISEEAIKSKLEEMVADYWAASVLGDVIEARSKVLDEAPKARYQRATEFVRRSLREHCGWGSDQTHPDGRFRLVEIFGKNASLRQALGCRELKKPSCEVARKISAPKN